MVVKLGSSKDAVSVPDPTVAWTVEEMAQVVRDLTPQDIADPRVREHLQDIRTTIDRRLDSAGRRNDA